MLPMMKKHTMMPSFIDEFFGKDFFNNYPVFGNEKGNIPAVNVMEDYETFKIEVAAPGLEKKDFKVEVKNNVLIISSEKQSQNEENNDKYIRREFSFSSFCRSFSLPNTANSEAIKASHKDGILMIEIPKKEEAKEKPLRNIEIS